MPKKNVAFPVSEDEHAKIKELAAKQRRTIKRLILDALDKLYPGGNREQKENDPK